MRGIFYLKEPRTTTDSSALWNFQVRKCRVQDFQSLAVMTGERRR